MKAVVVVVILVLMLSSCAYGVSLEKRHQIGLALGMWSQTTSVTSEIDFRGVETSVESSGPVGGITYGHWFEEYLELTIDISGMAAEVSTRTDVSGVYTKSSTVGSLLMGIKLYFPRSTFASSARPYAKVSVGPFIGDQSSTDVGTTITVESRSETALGGQIGAGVDFILGRHFMMGAVIGYNLMTDFDRAIGGSRNYSGPEFRFGFNYLFGKGVQ